MVTVSAGRTIARAVTLALTATVAATFALGPAASAAPSAAPRVINGDPGVSAQYPFLVALLMTDRVEKEGPFDAQFCGGTLTTPTTIVTAAHCVVDQRTGSVREPSSLLAAFGSRLRAPGLRVVQVAQVTPNPAYARRTAINDVAVLTLASPILDVPFLRPATPAEADSLATAGSIVRVAGWGNTSTTGKSFPNGFRVGRLIVFPDTSCGSGEPFSLNGVTFRGYPSADADPTVMLCAAGVTDSGDVVDSCNGDSGGPLVAGEGPDARLVGIVSWGQACASNFAGVYTRIASMQDFLVAHNAVGSLAPTIAPALTADPQSGRIVVGFTAGPDGAQVAAFAATVVDPATGQVWNCFAEPHPDGTPSFCIVDGLANGTPYDVSGISGSAAGNSPVAGPVSVTPMPVPVVGRILRVVAATDTQVAFRVTPTDPNGSPLIATVVVCSPLGGGVPRVAAVRGRTAVVSGLRPVRYSCLLHTENAVGAADSLPVIIRPRR